MAKTLWVRIGYSQDKGMVGQVIEYPHMEAKALVREGRGQLVDPPAPAGTPSKTAETASSAPDWPEPLAKPVTDGPENPAKRQRRP